MSGLGGQMRRGSMVRFCRGFIDRSRGFARCAGGWARDCKPSGIPMTRPDASATVVRTTALNQGLSRMAARLVSRDTLHDCREPILNAYACGGHDGPIDAA